MKSEKRVNRIIKKHPLHFYFWSLLKRGIILIYHYTSHKHPRSYCDEFEHRYNTSKIKDNDRFDINIKNCEGRLKYNDLIAPFDKYQIDSNSYSILDDE
jgi:hypothetical protein